MPQLSDLIEKRKFVKKEYRPWDLSGTGTVDQEIKKEPEKDTNQPVVLEKQAHIANKVSKNIPETGNKIGNDLDNNQVTIRQQSDNIQITEKKHIDNKQVTYGEHTDNVIDNILDNEIGNIEKLPYLIHSIKKLTGIQNNIFFYIINICSARGVLDTGNILTSDLANIANCSIGSAKTSLIRLLEKHLLIRLQGKTSRGGHMVLGITKEIQSAAIQAQQALFNPLKKVKSDNVLGNELSNVLGNMNGYSSSNIYNNTTTSLPEDWKKINFELLQDIGFSETQIRQLHDSHATTPEIVQDAIHKFSYSLEHNEKVKAYSDPLNVLMGVLRKGQKWNEPNYTPPKELALRQILEEKRKQKEKIDSMIKELIEIEFPEWKRKLTEDQFKEIVPEDVRKTNITSAIQAVLRTYYTEKILLPRLGFEIDNHSMLS